jgi:hypothetical protein
VLAGALLASAPARAQSTPVQPAADPSQVTVPVADDTQAAPPAPRWTADVSGGYAGRDGGPGGPFAIASLTRWLGRTYVRGAVTYYKSTLQQSDTALASDYLVGSASYGGNFNNWVFDVFGSYGRQYYGAIPTSTGSRASSHSGSPYLAAGGDFGRVFTIAPRWYLTPTVAATYAYGRLLRPSPDLSYFSDFETGEPAWTGIATLRIDHALDPARNNYVGLAASYHVTSNGLSLVVREPDAAAADGFDLRSRHFADGWEELGASGSFKLTGQLWLDAAASRSFGARAGDSTTASLGLRLNF